MHRKAVYKAAFILVVKTTEQSAVTMFNMALLTLQVLLQHGRLKMGHKQQPLRSKGEAGGAFVVISGIVRVACESGDGVALEDAFLGAGLFCLACHTE